MSSRALAALLVPVLLAATAAVVAFFLLPPTPSAADAELAYSGEQNVESSVFLPLAGWNAGTGRIEVAAIVTARTDSTGVCTLVAHSGSSELRVDQDAAPEASTMSCGMMVLSTGVTPGSWDVEVVYRSGEFTARSASERVEVTG